MATTTTKDGKIFNTEEISDQIHQLKADIGSLTQVISDLTKTKGDELARNVRVRADAMRSTGEAQLAELQQKAIESAETAEDYVRRNPATALGIAAGFGLLVGLISARR